MRQIIGERCGLIPIARITRTQGLGGELRVRIDLEDFRLFKAGQEVVISVDERSIETKFEDFRSQHGRWIAKFHGIESISAAEEWVGARISIPEEALEPPPEGSYFSFDLEGCEVRAGGKLIGPVSEVFDQGSTTLLKVDRNGREVLIPFVRAFLGQIDIAGKRIDVDLPDGLLELNE